MCHRCRASAVRGYPNRCTALPVPCRRRKRQEHRPAATVELPVLAPRPPADPVAAETPCLRTHLDARTPERIATLRLRRRLSLPAVRVDERRRDVDPATSGPHGRRFADRPRDSTLMMKPAAHGRAPSPALTCRARDRRWRSRAEIRRRARLSGPHVRQRQRTTGTRTGITALRNACVTPTSCRIRSSSSRACMP